MRSYSVIAIIFLLVFAFFMGFRFFKGAKAYPKKENIALVFFENAHPSFQLQLAKEIEDFYGSKTTIVPAMQLPQEAFYSPRQRYRADKLIAVLKEKKTSQYNRFIGFTTKDISTTTRDHKDFGIFGLAYCPGASGVVSSYRLNKNVSNDKTYERLVKVTLHEIGHTLGIPHCTSNDSKCFMNDAGGKLATVDRSQKVLCKDCQKKINL